jgi:hypothetical protein
MAPSRAEAHPAGGSRPNGLLPNVWHNPIKTVGAVREQSSAGKSGRFPGQNRRLGR